MTCRICKQPGHIMKDCQYNTYGRDKAGMETPTPPGTYFESGFRRDKEVIPVHLREFTNNALLDTGATATVCGRKWLHVYEESLTPQEREQIEIIPSRRMFCFGANECVEARIQKQIPVTICGKDSFLTVYVVNSDIPLLLCRDSMIEIKMKIDAD